MTNGTPVDGDVARTNAAYWNELARLHATGNATYDVEHVRSGSSSLRDLEVTELGPVAGQRLLHLQCHTGLDTISLARLGATVVGVDSSPVAIEVATNLARESSCDAAFVCCAVEALPEEFSQAFDVVFMSYGVLIWLADLRALMLAIRKALRPGGVLYLVDEHPFAAVFSPVRTGLAFQPYAPYDSGGRPYRSVNDVSYADPSVSLVNRTQYKWAHSMSALINAVVDAF